MLKDGVKGAQIQMMLESRHFPMLDEPEFFHDKLLTFLAA